MLTRRRPPQVVGNVAWRGRTAVLGPPIHKGVPKFRSVLGLEAESEATLPPAFNS